MDLEKVFVPLRLAPECVHKISSSIIKFQGKLSQLDIRDFLRIKLDTEPLYRSIAIIGPPGAGKTTLSQHLSLTYSKEQLFNKSLSKDILFPIILYFKEKEVVEAIVRSKVDLAELINQQEFIKTLNPPKNWIESKLNSEKCLVLLDGLDEIASKSERKKISFWLEKQIEKYSKTRFIITSRPFGYRDAPVDNIKIILEVQPFNQEQATGLRRDSLSQNQGMVSRAYSRQSVANKRQLI